MGRGRRLQSQRRMAADGPGAHGTVRANGIAAIECFSNVLNVHIAQNLNRIHFSTSSLSDLAAEVVAGLLFCGSHVCYQLCEGSETNRPDMFSVPTSPSLCRLESGSGYSDFVLDPSDFSFSSDMLRRQSFGILFIPSHK